MRFLETIFVSLTILAVANADLFPKLKEGWTFVPTKLGIPVPVNLEKLADMLQGPQLLSFVAEDHTTFELYTQKNPDKPQILKPNDLSSIASSNFNKSLPTRIYIHGWMEIPGLMKGYFNDAYLKKAKKNVNLIAVNWEKSSRNLNYITARNHVEPIGTYLASFIDVLVKNNFASLNDINLIGFSLGAHVAGIAGKQIQSGRLPKIVGLDPAAPLFPLNKPSERLDKNDAKYVEIIHTSGTWLGIHEPIGTSSFYPNHGKNQVGCKFDPTGTCSHLRAFKYFAESIYAPISFYGYPCSSLEDMKKSDCKGVGTRMGAEPGNFQTASKIYFLKTNDKSFFARGGSRDIE